MVPADQRLHSNDLTGPQVDLRLVEDAELFLLDRLAEVALDLATLDHPSPEVVVEQLAADAALLRPVHRRVGLTNQDLRVGRGIGGHDDANARGDECVVVLEAQRRLEALDDALGDRDGLLLVLYVLAEDDELVPAVTSRGVGAAQRVVETAANLHQDLVTGLVTEAVVDQLELVEVDKEDREGRVVSPRPRKGVGEAVHEEHAVGQSRQLVVRRLVLEVALALLALDRVADRAAELI